MKGMILRPAEEVAATKRIISQRTPALGAMSYVFMFFLLLVLVITSMYMLQMAKLMSQQHHIDDSLAAAVLASLVADDSYYFLTSEYDEPVIRLRDVDESYDIYVDCMEDAIAETTDFYYNLVYEEFIAYEVEGQQVTITTYTGNAGTKSVSTGKLGAVATPAGKVVEVTSAYARVSFDLRSSLDGSYVNRSKEIYCTLEQN